MGKTDEGKEKDKDQKISDHSRNQEASTEEREENMKVVDKAPQNPRH